MNRRVVVAGVLLALAAGASTAWWFRPGADAVTVDEIGDEVQTTARSRMPVFAGRGDTADLYRFASDRGDVLRHMPCTCGCADLGHASNRACYIKAEAGERVTWTSHAAT
jgi:hypothetical protein